MKHQARRLGQSFPHPTGTDHGRYIDQVIACFALRLTDYAKRFFPRESGLITSSHVTINRTGSLITALLHDEPEWKDKALNDARKFLQGKRQVTDRACVAYLVALYDGDPEAMSENLQIMMNNYLKGWLVMGTSCRLPLHGLYQMANLYLPEDIFQRVRRPEGPGWWNEYADLILQDPRPAELDQPYFVFPEPLGFMNEAIKAIDR